MHVRERASERVRERGIQGERERVSMRMCGCVCGCVSESVCGEAVTTKASSTNTCRHLKDRSDFTRLERLYTTGVILDSETHTRL